MPAERRFSEAEAEAILRRALAAQRADGMSREELVAAAQGVGLDAASVDAAIAAHDRGASDAELRASWRRARTRAFALHAALFAVVNTLLFAVDVATPPDDYWFYWPLLAWSVGLAMDLAGLRRGPSDATLAALREADDESPGRAPAGVRVASPAPPEVTEVAAAQQGDAHPGARAR